MAQQKTQEITLREVYRIQRERKYIDVEMFGYCTYYSKRFFDQSRSSDAQVFNIPKHFKYGRTG